MPFRLASIQRCRFDCGHRRNHNQAVCALLRRALVALALAPCLVLGPVMPQEHVHEIHEAHANAFAHRHAGFHQHTEVHAPDGDDHDDLAVSADDESPVWIAAVGLNPRAFHLSRDCEPADSVFTAPSNEQSATRGPDIDGSPPHGPPRPSFSLRGPPLASA